MFAIFTIFDKYAIFAKIASLKGNPLLLKSSPTRWRFFLPDSPCIRRAFADIFFLEQHYAAGGIMAFP